MFALFLKAERISPADDDQHHQGRAVVADKVHHFSLSLGSWD